MGSVPGEVTLGGRRIALRRLRVRSVEGEEVRLTSFAWAADRDPLQRRTMEAVAIGVSSRRYARSLDPLPPTMDLGWSDPGGRAKRLATGGSLRLYEP
jgi:putative transposase